jgi:hypothetical protein
MRKPPSGLIVILGLIRFSEMQCVSDMYGSMAANASPSGCAFITWGGAAGQRFCCPYNGLRNILAKPWQEAFSRHKRRRKHRCKASAGSILRSPSGEWNDPLCREIAQVRPLRGHPAISVLNHNLDSAD